MTQPPKTSSLPNARFVFELVTLQPSVDRVPTTRHV